MFGTKAQLHLPAYLRRQQQRGRAISKETPFYSAPHILPFTNSSHSYSLASQCLAQIIFYQTSKVMLGCIAAMGKVDPKGWIIYEIWLFASLPYWYLFNVWYRTKHRGQYVVHEPIFCISCNRRNISTIASRATLRSSHGKSLRRQFIPFGV